MAKLRSRIWACGFKAAAAGRREEVLRAAGLLGTVLEQPCKARALKAMFGARPAALAASLRHATRLALALRGAWRHAVATRRWQKYSEAVNSILELG